MKILIGIVSVLIILLMAYAVSYDRKHIKIKPLVWLLSLQLIFAYAMLNSNIGQVIINGIVAGFDKLLKFAGVGIHFVFGGIINDNSFSFFFNVLMPIVFISALIGILQYWKVLNCIIRAIGFLLSKVNGMGKLESYNAVGSAILGHSQYRSPPCRSKMPSSTFSITPTALSAVTSGPRRGSSPF